MDMRLFSRKLNVFLLSVFLLGSSQVKAQSSEPYPNKPVRLIVPFAPGATTDFLGRVIAQHMTQAWGKSVLVENKIGAGGLIGADATAKSAPDGYTLCVSTGAIAIYPATKLDMPFDTMNDFEFVAMLGRVPHVVVVHKDFPANTFQEFVAQTKNGKQYPYATTGARSNSHFTGEMLKTSTGIALEHVPYRGGAPAMADLVAGHIQIMIASLTTAMPFIKSGAIKPLAISSGTRSSTLPNTPSLKELGYPEIDTAEWWGLIGPKNTPKPIMDKWREELKKVITPAILEKSPGLELYPMSPEEMKKLVQKELTTWKEVAKRSNITE
jgi:tripartite-type tricarboxylate transporter receptor subunit TctC